MKHADWCHRCLRYIRVRDGHCLQCRQDMANDKLLQTSRDLRKAIQEISATTVSLRSLSSDIERRSRRPAPDPGKSSTHFGKYANRWSMRPTGKGYGIATFMDSRDGNFDVVVKFTNSTFLQHRVKNMIGWSDPRRHPLVDNDDLEYNVSCAVGDAVKIVSRCDHYRRTRVIELRSLNPKTFEENRTGEVTIYHDVPATYLLTLSIAVALTASTVKLTKPVPEDLLARQSFMTHFVCTTWDRRGAYVLLSRLIKQGRARLMIAMASKCYASEWVRAKLFSEVVLKAPLDVIETMLMFL
eukprot:PhF_6_TR40591/c0_g1_i1/m.60884